MRLRLTLALILLFVSALHLHGQDKLRKSYILELSGSCSPGELSIEFFIRGGFGGYSSFIPTDSRFTRYEVPAFRDGMHATSLKLMIRGARCRTQIIDLPELDKVGSVIRTRLRRARTVEFRGRINSPGELSRDKIRLTVDYWAHWKCQFMGVPDCLIGPNRIDSVDVDPDGKFKVRLPDLANDPALASFVDKGTFQFFIRERSSGNILYNLICAMCGNGSRSLPVAAEYEQDNEFVLEPNSESAPAKAKPDQPVLKL